VKPPRPTPALGEVTALVLCGGFGTRLRSVLGTLPKVLAPIAGRPFLAYQLSFLRGQGLTDVVLCTGHAADQVEACCGDGSHWGLRLRYSREPRPLGTAGALKHAQSLIGSNPFLVLNGDTFVGADLARLVRDHTASDAALTLAVAEVADLARFGAVTLDPDGRVTAFGEKGRSGPGRINAGIYAADAAVLGRIPSGGAVSLEYDVFPALVGKGLRGTTISGPFLDIGTEETYHQAEAFLAQWPPDEQK
jgi:NDP-sugar pyrophosphorylase family protein